MRTLCSTKFTSMTLASMIAAVMAYVILLSNNIILGHYIGESAIGGIGLVSPIYTFAISASALITEGSSCCAFNESSMFHTYRMKSFFTAGIVYSLALGMLLCFMSFAFKAAYFNFVSDSDVEYSYASEYYDAFCMVLLIYPVNHCLQEMVYKDGDEPLFIISALAQLIGSIFFSIILCFRLGVSGVALGSFLGIAASLIILGLHFIGRKSSLGFHGRISWNKTKAIFDIATYPAVITILKTLLVYLLNLVILYIYGSSALPAVTALNLITGLITIFSASGSGASPLLILYNGECNVLKLRDTMKLAKKFSLTTSITGTVVMLIFAESFIRMIGISSEELFTVCVTGVRILALSYTFASLLEVLISYHVSVGNIKYSYWASIVDLFVIKILIMIPLILYKGIIFLWICYALSPVIIYVASMTIFKSKCDLKQWPVFMDATLENETFSFDLVLTPESIRDLQLKIELLLDTYEVPSNIKLKASILTEEIFHMILEKNPGKRILAECSAQFTDYYFILIFKDNGIIFNAANAEGDIQNFREFVLSSVINQADDSRNMITLCYNRSAFRFDYTIQN